ncbi:hypothetical protein ACC728_39890, partial [Rhizobium ruizarguesonis]
SVLYLASAYMYATKKQWFRKALTELGYSANNLVPFMIIVKFLGPVAILSRVSLPLSDLANAGADVVTTGNQVWDQKE